jgi:hypothetical protein
MYDEWISYICVMSLQAKFTYLLYIFSKKSCEMFENSQYKYKHIVFKIQINKIKIN